MSRDEAPLLEHINDYLYPGYGPYEGYPPDRLLTGDESLRFAELSVDVLRVPGHSPAHLAFLIDGHLFSGDVLFAGSVGRTDLPGASWEELEQTLQRLVDTLPPETPVHPGHGPETTLGAELATNPFLQGLVPR
jgi:glyoxylase-like metal-dependent hydrolase (beta-lactamase superfamily II)